MAGKLRRRAKPVERADRTLGRPGRADLPPKVDYPQREIGPQRRIEQPLQVVLDLRRIVVHREPQAAADAPHVRVDHHAGSAKGSAENHVRRLPSDAVQLEQLFHRLGHDAAEFLVERPGHLHDRPRLLPEKAGRVNDTLELGQLRRGELRRRPVPVEQDGGHFVHLGIGGLGRKNRGNEELQRVAVLQRQPRHRIARMEDRGDLRCAPARAGKGLTGRELRF